MQACAVQHGAGGGACAHSAPGTTVGPSEGASDSDKDVRDAHGNQAVATTVDSAEHAYGCRLHTCAGMEAADAAMRRPCPRADTQFAHLQVTDTSAPPASDGQGKGFATPGGFTVMHKNLSDAKCKEVEKPNFIMY